MPINTETLNRKLYNKLSKYSPKPLDASGKVTPVEDEADVFKFKFTMNGKDYGDVFATVDDERRLILYYGDDVGDSPESPTPNLGYNDTWLGFVEDLKSWKTRNGFKGWQLKNQDQLAPDMARRNHMKKKDKLGEGYYPMGKKASYSDAIPTIKMVIQHSRQIEEGEKRYRNISKIFLENQDGERFLAPTIKPGIARVYARHIAEGGKPHDDRWNHIGSLCEEYQKMAGFVRATRGQQFNESTQKLVESGIQHYQSLRESLSRMTGHRGYNSYFDSWSPPLMEDDADTSVVNELFVQETLDPRIESVMPILSKLHKTVAEMKEVDQLAEWADSLVEFAQHDHNDDGDDSEDSSHLDFLYSRKFDLESELDYADEEDKKHIQSELDDINDEIESLGGLSEDDGMQSNNSVGIPEAIHTGAALQKYKDNRFAPQNEPAKPAPNQGVAEGSLNEGQYEMMMRNGQVKKFIAKDDADAKRIAAGHGAKSVIKLRGGVPAGKVAEQGVAEDSHEEQVARLAAYNERMAGENPPIDLGLREVGNWAKVGHYGNPIKTAWYNIAKYGVRNNRFKNSVDQVMSAIGEFPDLEDEVYDMYDINQDEVDALYHAYETVYDQWEQSQGATNENFINMAPQAVAEGLDDTQRARLDALIDQYSDSVDPDAYYGLDDEYPDSDEVIAQIRQEFGDKIADTVEAGASKMHFPRHDNTFDHDPLQRKMSPRVTKSGKINRQDNDYMKREIKRRMNYTSGGPKGVLPEGQEDLNTIKRLLGK
jgi:hypothetical protein